MKFKTDIHHLKKEHVSIFFMLFLCYIYISICLFVYLFIKYQDKKKTELTSSSRSLGSKNEHCSHSFTSKFFLLL